MPRSCAALGESHATGTDEKVLILNFMEGNGGQGKSKGGKGAQRVKGESKEGGRGGRGNTSF